MWLSPGPRMQVGEHEAILLGRSHSQEARSSEAREEARDAFLSARGRCIESAGFGPLHDG